MKRNILTSLIFLNLITIVFAQDNSEDFKPHGKPIVLLFPNFNTEFTNGAAHPEFGLTRAYFGYEHNFSNQFYAKIVMDFGNPKAGDYQMVGFLKNAYIQYTHKNLTAYFGVISTTQFKVSEKIWGYRYIDKTFQDAYKFNSSADLGFNIDYEFTDFLSADFSLINGEGYKRLQSDDYLRPGLGVTVKPIKNITTRLFADYMGGEVKQQSLALFAAYTGSKLIVGAEFNYQKNFGMQKDHDVYGPSVYATIKTAKRINVFVRYDHLKSTILPDKTEPWQLGEDGQLLMGGVEFNPIKGVKISPNVRFWKPADKLSFKSLSAFLNFELKI